MAVLSPEELCGVLRGELREFAQGVRDELGATLCGSLGDVARELGQRVRRDLREELQALLQETRPESSDRPSTPPSGPAPRPWLPGQAPGPSMMGRPSSRMAGSWCQDDAGARGSGRSPTLESHHSQGSCALGGALEVVGKESHYPRMNSAPNWAPRVMAAASRALKMPERQQVRQGSVGYVDNPSKRTFLVMQQEPAMPGRGTEGDPQNLEPPSDSKEPQPLRLPAWNLRAGTERTLSIAHGLHRRTTISWGEAEPSTKILKSHLFDYGVCAMLILNALTIGLQVDCMAKSPREAVPQPFRVIETIFCVIFTIELGVRLFIHRLRFFCMASWKWNIFDFLVVSMQLTEVLVRAAAGGDDDEVSLSSNFKFMNLLRFLRLFRILRLFRLVNVVQELNKLVYLIIGSLWSFLWTVALLLLMTYIGGVFFTQLVADFRREPGAAESVSERDLPRFFGSLGGSVLSLLAATSGGLDWTEVLVPLMQDISPLLALVFLLYIAFSVLVIMNLVTGVFVDGAKRLTNNERERELLRKVERCFLLSDLDTDRLITWDEFHAQLETPQMYEFLKSVDFNHIEAATLFALLDRDNTGSLTAEEFVQGTLRLRGSAKAFDLAALQHECRQQARWLRAHASRVEELLARERAPAQEEQVPRAPSLAHASLP